jgi:hypothetical protein
LPLCLILFLFNEFLLALQSHQTKQTVCFLVPCQTQTIGTLPY